MRRAGGNIQSELSQDLQTSHHLPAWQCKGTVRAVTKGQSDTHGDHQKAEEGGKREEKRLRRQGKRGLLRGRLESEVGEKTGKGCEEEREVKWEERPGLLPPWALWKHHHP